MIRLRPQHNSSGSSHHSTSNSNITTTFARHNNSNSINDGDGGATVPVVIPASMLTAVESGSHSTTTTTKTSTCIVSFARCKQRRQQQHQQHLMYQQQIPRRNIRQYLSRYYYPYKSISTGTTTASNIGTISCNGSGRSQSRILLCVIRILLFCLTLFLFRFLVSNSVILTSVVSNHLRFSSKSPTITGID